jgi:site-specific DNA-cytosine methylase
MSVHSSSQPGSPHTDAFWGDLTNMKGRTDELTLDDAGGLSAAIADTSHSIPGQHEPGSGYESSNAGSVLIGPLEDACSQWFSQIDRDPAGAAEFKNNWKKTLEHLSRLGVASVVDGYIKIPFGSLYSGSNICDYNFNVLEAELGKLGIRVKFVHKFSAEIKDEKRKHIMQNARPELLFGDVASLHEPQALDYISGELRYVPRVGVAIIGFPCTSKTRLSSKSGANAYCVQKGEGATGVGWTQTKLFIKNNLVVIVVLENVQELDNDPMGTGYSDLAFIIDELKELGYAVFVTIHDAASYGSLANRTRVWICCVLGLQSPDAGVMFKSLMQLQRIDSLAPEDFISVDLAEFDDAVQSLQLHKMTADKKTLPREDYDFRREHMQLFEAHSLGWPPGAEAFDCDRWRRLLQCGERVKELAYFIDQAFAAPAQQRVGVEYSIQFADLRDSAQRLLGWKIDTDVVNLKDPWSFRPSTLTSGSRLIMRVTSKGASVSYVRPLEGVESMALIGWDMQFWRQPQFVPSYETCVSMSGNAMSAFSIGPVLNATMAVAGFLADQPETLAEPEEPEVKQKAPAIGSCEESEYSDDDDAD